MPFSAVPSSTRIERYLMAVTVFLLMAAVVWQYCR
jgi:hypothetical protein